MAILVKNNHIVGGDATDIVTEWAEADKLSDEKVPSEKLVKDTLDNGKAVTTTWEELKALRDDKKLIPGTLYRITDYQCTTVQANTRAKDNKFDIIVTAIDKETLNEAASATYHEGDTYFANEALPIWELKYCLDNDTTRFVWADTANGKGVIWYMKDEYDNECAYDFKNIQFLRDAAFNTKYSDGVTHYYLTAADYYYYTFTLIDKSNNVYDLSCMNTIKTSVKVNWNCTGNKLLGLSLSTANNIRELTCNVICANVTGTNNERSICYNTITGNRNTFGGRNVNNNYLSGDVYNNFFADEGYCYGNEFEQAYNNVFKGPCFSNRVSYTGFNANTFHKKCASNTFNGWVEKCTFKGIFSYNIIGGLSASNTFNQDSLKNNYGHNFIGNVLDCYVENNTFGNNIQYVHFNGDTTKVVNYYIANGLQGTSTTKLEVTPIAGLTVAHMISKKVNGDIIDCPIPNEAGGVDNALLQFEEAPTDDDIKVFQYIGETSDNFTENHIYELKEVSDIYKCYIFDRDAAAGTDPGTYGYHYLYIKNDNISTFYGKIDGTNAIKVSNIDDLEVLTIALVQQGVQTFDDSHIVFNNSAGTAYRNDSSNDLTGATVKKWTDLYTNGGGISRYAGTENAGKFLYVNDQGYIDFKAISNAEGRTY